MQKASFAQSERYDSKGVVDRINELARKLRISGEPIIFVQHDGNDTDGHEAHTEGWEILDELVKETGAEVIGVAVLIDRCSIELPFEYFATYKKVVENFKPEECPLCKVNAPLTKLGGL